MTLPKYSILFASLLIGACQTTPIRKPDLTIEEPVNYIWLKENVFTQCVYCHTSSGRVNLALYDEVMTVVERGDPLNSRLYQMVASGRMPKGGRLSDEHIAKIYYWIERGAPRR